MNDEGCCYCPIFRLFSLVALSNTYTYEALNAQAPTLMSEIGDLLAIRCHEGALCPMRFQQATAASLYIDVFNSLASPIASPIWTLAQIEALIQALTHLVDLVNNTPIRLQLIKNLA